MDLPQAVSTALEALEAAGWEAWVVGGAVRDALRGVSATDWDLTTNARPEQVEAVFAGYPRYETGLQHGTVTVQLDGLPLEITTYREDGAYSDHRRPDQVRFASAIAADLRRRDLTVNAMAYHPARGLLDLYGGQADLQAGLIRCVGQPDRRFQEDGLRILRALRFAAVLGFRLEEATGAAVLRNRLLLERIAAERVREELTRLLCGPGAAAVLRAYRSVLAVPLPEAAPMFDLPQHHPHHDRDVWEHTLAAVDACPPDPVLRWAALLHDMGKPACFTQDADGVGHFHGHGAKSAALAEAVLRRLRFDNRSREQIVTLVRYHDLPLETGRTWLRRRLHRLGEPALRRLIALHRADTLAQSALSRPRLETCREAEAALDALLAEQPCFSLRDLAVNGRDAMALGFRGAEIGQALNDCLNAVLDEVCPNQREPLLARLQARRMEEA